MNGHPSEQGWRKRGWPATCIWVAAGLVGLCLAGRCNEALVQMRSAYRLNPADPVENAPPLVTFTTVVLGGFSGLIADMLWLRVSRLQDEGRYVELVQLADWIAKLEPRNAEVWGFHAWNMAYNVSVMMPDFEDRWRWVRSAIALLRDEGLEYNRGDSKLCWELGWLFQNKIGGNMDHAASYYRRQWAREMTALFDGPCPDAEELDHKPDVANRLRKEYKLDPILIAKTDREYGPLDWRLPEAHAVYWACRGRERAGPGAKLPSERMIMQSMSAAFRQGRLAGFLPDGNLDIHPNLELLLRVLRTYEALLEEHPGEETLKTAYANFLGTAVRLLNRLDHRDEARNLFQRMAARFPSPETANGFDAFIMRETHGE